MHSPLTFYSILGSLLLTTASTPAKAAATTPSFFPGHNLLLPRADDIPQEVCSDLSINSNNGDRKVAIVIDSSGSMADNDPDNLRLVAGRALNDFLISDAEAGGKTPDQVVVIAFDQSSYTVFGPGDPGDPVADEQIGLIEAVGGTYIAGGVLQAIDEIGKMSGKTNERSAIVVFTDGSDYSPDILSDAIKNATSLGIRVSFGFLDLSASYQPEEILLAVRESKGVYATITLAAGSRNFVNYVLLNGLTYRDNPQGAGDRLLSGLATTQFIEGSDSVTLKYTASKGEKANFTLISITGDQLKIEAKMGGKSLNSSEPQYSDSVITVEPPNSGELDVIVTAHDNPVNGLFSVVTNSNQPIKNCTVGVTGNKTGLSTGAKAGLGVGLTALLLGLAGGGFWAYEHFLGGPSSAAPAGGNTTSGPTGLEKAGAHTNVYPVDPSEGIAPSGGGQGLGQAHTALPDIGAGSQGFAPAGSGPAPPPAGVPPSGVAPPPAAMAGVGSVPSIFVPPLVPPNVFNQGSKPGTPNRDGVSPQHTSYNLPQQPGNTTGYQNVNPYLSAPDGAQHPMGNYNGYQDALPDGGGTGASNTSGVSPATSYSNTYHSPSHTGSTPVGGGSDITPYQPSVDSTTPFNPSNNGEVHGNTTSIHHLSPSTHGHTYTGYGVEPASYEGGITAGDGHNLNHTNWNQGQTPNHTTFDTDSSNPNHTNFDSGTGTAPITTDHPNYYSNPNPNPGPAPPASNPLPPGAGDTNNPGFTMPGTQLRMGFGAGNNMADEKHHHHPWLAPDSACEHPECPLNLASHECVPGPESCECRCPEGGCAYLRRRGVAV